MSGTRYNFWLALSPPISIAYRSLLLLARKSVKVVAKAVISEEKKTRNSLFRAMRLLVTGAAGEYNKTVSDRGKQRRW